MRVDVLHLRAAKPLEWEFNFIGKHLDSDQLKVDSAEIKVLFAWSWQVLCTAFLNNLE